ncbi:MAG: hypothetical protein ACYCRE_05275, partial [Acidobacteriaceae bacterium]
QEQEPTTLRNGILQKTSDLTPERLAWWICCPCGLLWVGTMVLLLQGRRINRRRLERLEALLAERP